MTVDAAAQDEETPVRTWQMWAGVDERYGTFEHIGSRWYTEAYGHDAVAVTVTEDPDGTYWAWLDARHPDGDRPEMIQSRRSLYDIQFTYGASAEEARGKGRTLRVRVQAAPTR